MGYKVYVVNECTSVGYIRIEEYILEEPLHEDIEIKGCYRAKQKDCSYDLIIHESLLNDNNVGFIFINLEDAVKLYKEKSVDILKKLIEKINDLKNEHDKLLKDALKIAYNLKQENIDNLNIIKCYENN